MEKIMSLVLFLGFLTMSTSCQTLKKSIDSPRFVETVMDEHGAKSIWMKTYGDINGNGLTDIVVGGRRGGGLVAYLAPDWERQIINDTLVVSTDGQVVDINNNGKNDIAVVLLDQLAWLSAPDWEIHSVDKIKVHDVEVADLDGDGQMDMVARNQGAFGRGDVLYIYQQKPLGVWTKQEIKIVDGEGLLVRDMNGNGKPDIVINGYWFENTGDINNWNLHQYTDTWTWPHAYLDIADMNNDGRLDILMAPAELHNQYYRISWFEAPKDPTAMWKEHVVVDSIEAVIHFIGAADFNLNGKKDIMYAHMKQGNYPQEVAVLYQGRKNTWEKEVLSNDGSHSMILYDFDGDGDIDAVGANHQEDKLKMWINQTK